MDAIGSTPGRRRPSRLAGFLAVMIAVALPPVALGPARAGTAGTPAEHDEDEAHGHQEEDEHGHHEEAVVELTDAEREEFGLVVAAAGPGTIRRFVSLPGEVRPNADRLAHIVPRYSGIVADVRAHIGDVVKEHEVLALVESDESLAPYELKTLIPGTIISKHITLGEAVSRDVATYVIADLSTVWVDVTVYQRDIARVRVGQQVLIESGEGLPGASGTITYITPVVDERTRTATARVVLPNPDGTWRPGIFVTARILVEEEKVPLAVPRTAVHTVESLTVVFVETGHGFTPEPVLLGRSGETHVEILSGLEPGDRYVSRGGFTLKAELGKESFGHGHAH